MNQQTQMSEQSIKVTLLALDNIINKQQSNSQKSRLQTLKNKIIQTRQGRNLRILVAYQTSWLKLIRQGYTCYKRAYDQLKYNPKYQQSITSDFNVAQHLQAMIPQLQLTKQTLTFNNLAGKITMKNLMKLKKTIGRDFLNDWSSKAKQIQIMQQQNQKKRQIQQDRLKRQKEAEERQKQQMQQKQQQERVEKDRRDKAKNVKQQDLKRVKRDGRNKWTGLEKYIEARRDIVVDKAKNKQFCQYLGGRLQTFLKKTLQKVYDTACLKNKKNPALGNQLGYFGVDQQRTNPQAGFFIQPSSKIYCLTYKHKLDIYSQLRNKQFAKEQAIRQQLQTKAGQSERKMERKLENYLFRGRDAQVPAQWKERGEAGGSVAVHITFEHFIEYMQLHGFLRNSLVLFNAYHT